MKFFLIVFFNVFYFNSFSQKNRVFTLDDDYEPSYISFEFGLGGGRGFTTIDTGFEVDDGSMVTFLPSSGALFKFSANFFHKKRLTYGLSYSYQLGGLSNLYENGDGDNTRKILTPTIRFAPFLSNKGKFNLGVGLNMVLSNYLEVEAKLPTETLFARYDFKRSYGPTVMAEYQEDLYKWAGWRIGLSYNYMHYELSSMKLNNVPLRFIAAPYDMIEHSASSVDYYVAFYVYL